MGFYVEIEEGVFMGEKEKFICAYVAEDAISIKQYQTPASSTTLKLAVYRIFPFLRGST